MNGNLNKRLLNYVKQTFSENNSRIDYILNFFDTDVDFEHPTVDDWAHLVETDGSTVYGIIDLRIKICDMAIKGLDVLGIPSSQALSTLEIAKCAKFPAIRNRAIRYSYFKNVDDLLDSFSAQYYTRCGKSEYEIIGFGRWLPTICTLLLFWYGFEVNDMLQIKRTEMNFKDNEVSIPFRGSYRTLSHPRVVSILKEYAKSNTYLSVYKDTEFIRVMNWYPTEYLFRSSRNALVESSLRNAIAQLKNPALTAVNPPEQYEVRLYTSSSVSMSAKFLMAYKTICIPQHINPARGLSLRERNLLVPVLGANHTNTWEVSITEVFTEWVRCFYPDADTETRTWM